MPGPRRTSVLRLVWYIPHSTIYHHPRCAAITTRCPSPSLRDVGPFPLCWKNTPRKGEEEPGDPWSGRPRRCGFQLMITTNLWFPDTTQPCIAPCLTTRGNVNLRQHGWCIKVERIPTTSIGTPSMTKEPWKPIDDDDVRCDEHSKPLCQCTLAVTEYYLYSRPFPLF